MMYKITTQSLTVHRISSANEQVIKIRLDESNAPVEYEIEISANASQDECSGQRGIDEIAGVWVQETSAATSPTPTERAAICTFQVHTKARRGGRSKL